MKRLLFLAMASLAAPDDEPHTPDGTEAWTTPPRTPDAAAAWTQPRELRGRPPLRIITWNVWFDHRRQKERLKLLLALLAKENADVIGLQEVTTEVAARIRQHAGVTARYDISENDISAYGCLLLVRRELNPAFAELPLPTTMGRSLVAACV